MSAASAAEVLAPSDPRPVTPVGILAARLDRIADRLAELPGAHPALVHDLAVARALAGGLEPYLDRWTTPESAELSYVAEQTRSEDWGRPSPRRNHLLEQEMLSGHVEGQFLKMLVHISRARRVLDVGMFTGYSALAMAEALPADGTVVACELDPGVAGFARGCLRTSAHRAKIDIRVGPALATLTELASAGEAFDLIFIDADKAGYVDYLHAVLDSSLLADGGLLCADNTLLQGQPWVSEEATANGEAIAAFNQAVAEDARVEQVIVPLRDGITLIRRVGDGR